MRRPHALSRSETLTVAAIETGVPLLVEARELIASFQGMVRKRAAAELGAWLEAEGWSELEDYEFTTESVNVNAVGISAEKPFVGIEYMQVTYYYEGDYGTDYPHIVVDIDSECLIDDSNGESGLAA